jgi:CubicO group peptidase (beta-lactamase class C family)
MVNRRQFLLGAAAGFSFLPASNGFAQQIDILRDAIAQLPKLHSIQVQKGSDLVFAEAPRGAGIDRVANIKSCSKSIVALLLGIAIDRGEIPNVKALLVDVAPSLIPEDATAGVEDLTLEDLVTLRAGLERTSGANYGEWISSSNWIQNLLRRPMVARPGERMLYSTGTSHLLGAALTEATGKSLLTQAVERLGDPMSFQVPPWTRDPQGYFLGGNQMALTPRAMLKIALMLRDGGRFEDEQIVPADWARTSLVVRTRSPYSGLGYGYGWFLTQSGFALARGYGGQVIAAHQEKNLAVAITSDPNSPARSDGYFGDLLDLLEGPILALA